MTANETQGRTLPVTDLSLVVLIGASGSGKSTFARRHFKPTEVISSDFCRGLVSDDENDQSATLDAFDPREIDAFVAKLDPRRELVYRIAVRDLCDRCRCDRRFKQRTEELMQRFKGELSSVLIEAGKLTADLTRH